ncbi:MAG: hypothetical protein AB1633_11260 [Elusimicrobiota bacterium]
MGKRERYSPEYKLEAIRGIDAGRKKGLGIKEASKMYGICDLIHQTILIFLIIVTD